MKKTSYSSASPRSGNRQGSSAKGDTYKDRNLVPVNPLKEQFEPTDNEPVRQHARMAGTC